MIEERYLAQARALVRYLPYIEKQGCFALKGGTAFNLFYAAAPRLSVDIDLVYMPIVSRQETKAAIQGALENVEREVKAVFRGVRTTWDQVEQSDFKLLIRTPDVLQATKIEPNLTLRGLLETPLRLSTTPQAEALLGVSAEMTVAAIPDLVGGKMVAAMDRQHPRDFYDLLPYLAGEGLTSGMLRGFLAYAAASTRPLCELLKPTIKPLKQDYENVFVGMTTEHVPLEALETARENLIAQISRGLDPAAKEFLLAMDEKGEVRGDLIGYPLLSTYPGQTWKAQNIRLLARTNSKKHAGYVERLKSILG